MQALITKPVIDTLCRVPHGADMLTHDQIREELIRQLENGTLKAVEVARKLCIAPARVTEMRKRERRVQPEEMPVLAELLGLAEAYPLKAVPIENSPKVRHLGKVAQGVWLDESMIEPDPDDYEYVPYDRRHGDPSAADLFAVTPEGTSMNLAFKPSTMLICRRVPFGVGQFKSGDYVIAARAAHDLREMTCKRVEIDDEGAYWLHSETDDDRFKKPWRIGRPNEQHHGDEEVRIIAKVIRAVRDYER